MTDEDDHQGQYDAIGERYERAKRLPVGLAETVTLLSALPPLTGLSVLDVACGTGYYPRLYAGAGARRVLGVDASRVMVSHAARIEEHDPQGISYEVLDAVALPRIDGFDVVTAVWLLGYAEGEAALDLVLANLRANVRPGGTLVALVPNPDIDWDRLDGLPRYGISCWKTVATQGRQGYTVRIDDDPPVELDGFAWPPGVLESAFERAGLVGLRRFRALAPDDGTHEPGYWDEFLANPTFTVYRVTAP